MEKGSRVGAIRNADKETVYLFGYGTYEGDEVPPIEVGGFLTEIGIGNPKIVLDSGNVVWGCQCWWGSEEKTKNMIGNRKIEIVVVT